MQLERLVEMLLEATDEQRAELIGKLKDEGYEFVDEANVGGYDLILWNGHKTRNGKPISYYELSLNHGDLDFTGPEQQLGKQPGGSTQLAGSKSKMMEKVVEWLNRFGTIYVGSFDDRKLQVYRRIIKKYMPELKVSDLFKGFDDSVKPDYFMITGSQPQFKFESVQATFKRVIGESEFDAREYITSMPNPALQEIEDEYETLDVNIVYLEAASKRSGSMHEEGESSGRPYCAVCGFVDEGEPDPVYHPEFYLEEL